MGGTGFSIPIARTAGAEGSPQDLYYALIALLTKNARALVKGKAYKQVTDDYLGLVIDDGAGREDCIELGFRDGAGLCEASTHACAHWFELLVSALAEKKGAGPSPLEQVIAEHGFRLTKRPPPLEKLLAKCAAPLVVLRGHVYGVDGGKDPYLVGDELDDVDRLELDDLRPKEKEMALAALRERRCACVVCEALRSPKTKLHVPKPPKAPKAPKKPSKAAAKLPAGVKTSLRGKHRDVTVDKGDAVPEAVLTPKTLESLNINGAVARLPDALASMAALAVVRFSRTAFRRLPDVLGRMPALRQLGFYLDALDAPADLATIPKLTSLRVSNMPAFTARLGELPFDALGELERLELYDNRTAALPDGVGRLRTLCALEASQEALTDLPASIGRLERLSEVGLWGNQLRALPAVLREVRSITRLVASGNPLTTLPDWLGELPALDSLDLDDCPIVELPRGLARSTSLRDLSLGSPALRVASGDRLPGSLTSLALRGCSELAELGDLSSLRELEELRLHGCTVLTLPPSLAKLSKLRLLQLTNSTVLLGALPDWLGDLPITELALTGAPIAELPAWIRRLRLTHLQIGQMPNLKVLPDWLAELPLTYVDLLGTELRKGERARIKALLPKADVA